jgi:histidine triad (HIT) family protein
MPGGSDACLFCGIVAGRASAVRVFEDEISFAFLDNRPLFPGHVLLVPRAHYPTLSDLPEALVAPLFGCVQRVAAAVERAMHAEGTFVALNNRVSQSVPHLHVHVVPRRKGDGLRGFFWPRQRYPDAAEMERLAAAIRAELG